MFIVPDPMLCFRREVRAYAYYSDLARVWLYIRANHKEEKNNRHSAK